MLNSTDFLTTLLFDPSGTMPPDLLAELENLSGVVKTASDTELNAQLIDQVFDLFIFISPDGPIESTSSLLQTRQNDFANTYRCLFTNTGRVQQQTFFQSVFDESLLKNKKAAVALLRGIISLSRMEKYRNEFAALIWHDIRSPLQSIISYLELLDREVFGEMNPGQQQIINNVIDLTDLLVDLVDELSLIHQFEEGKFQLQKSPVQLRELLDEVMRAIWVQADKKEIKILMQIEDKLPTAMFDYRGIQRLVLNLITNAVKFTPQKGVIRVEADIKKNSSGDRAFRFLVTDSGEGIPNEILPFLFDRYFRLNNKKYASRKAGFGLGLYISRLIVQSHHGEIGVYNNREGGATFYFTIPIEA